MEILTLNFLKERLTDSVPRVRMWATYHLVELWGEEAGEFIGYLIDSEIDSIKESGIYLIGKYNLTEYAFRLLHFFNSNNKSLRSAAALSMAEMCYENAERPLFNWLEKLLDSNEINISEFQNAFKCYLLFDQEKGWDYLEQKLSNHYDNHLKSINLFSPLCEQANTPERIIKLQKHYKLYRKNFNDPEFFTQWVNLFESENISDFIRKRLRYGYPLSLIYQECMNILGWKINPDAQKLFNIIDRCCTENIVEELPQTLLEFMSQTFNDAEYSQEGVFLQETENYIEDWSDAILKIRDGEFYLILAMPLLYFIKKAEIECLKNLENSVTRISRIYHSPLLRFSFMCKVIKNIIKNKFRNYPFAPLLPDFTHESFQDALWRIATNSINENYPFPKILPEPWQYKIPEVISHLLEWYTQNFDTFIATQQNEHIEYALKLFHRNPDESTIELVLKYFPVLINRHFNTFFEFVEYLPDKRFIEKLIQHYRPGETDIYQLVNFLCAIHNEKAVSEKLLVMNEENHEAPTSVRILCPECHCSYQYGLQILYFDVEPLEQRRMLTSNDLWTPSTLLCKACNANLPFILDQSYLSSLYSELLTARVLKLTEEEQKIWDVFKPLVFPIYFGKKTNPGIFIRKVEIDLKSNHISSHDKGKLLLELGKLYLAIEKLDESQTSFRKSLELLGISPIALFNLGIIAFRNKNLFDARLHFSRLVNSFTIEDFPNDQENLIELASHYLLLLEQREFKRASFKIF